MNNQAIQALQETLSFIKDSGEEVAVSVHKVSKYFGNEQVLKDIFLELEKGKIHGKLCVIIIVKFFY